jgi:hypothetical protein
MELLWKIRKNTIIIIFCENIVVKSHKINENIKINQILMFHLGMGRFNRSLKND